MCDKTINFDQEMNSRDIIYGYCPFCESGDIEKDIPENYGETVEVHCSCNECGKVWDEIYNFSMSILL